MYSGMMANLDYYLSQKPIHPTKMLRSGPITGSFFDVIKGFIHSVNTMESTVLVPTLLKDINLDGVTWVPTLMAKGNYRQLFEIYCLIKKCKSHFTEVDFDDIENSSFSSAIKGNRLNQNKAKELAKTIDSSFLMFSIESDFVNPDYSRPSSKVSDTTSSSTSSTPTLSSSSSVTTNTGSDRKQKISLDSGNWSSRGSDSIDDDFDFDTSNGISGSSIVNDVPINYLNDSDDINDSNNNTSNNIIHNHDHQLPSPSPSPLPLPQHQQQPLTVPTLLRATSTNLRNLKALFNNLKEVADFVTQQYLQALQLI